MPNLYDALAEAQDGKAMAELGQQYGLSPQQTRAAVTALLPAISMGLKRSTATPEGLGNLLALMGAQPNLYAMYDDPQVAFSPAGRAAGNIALSRIFGSPDASRAIANQAQQLSGVSSTILKNLLPVIAGMILSSLMRSGSGKAAPTAPEPSTEQGGGLIDILRQIFRQGSPEAGGQSQSPIPPITDILGPERETSGSAQTHKQAPPAEQSRPVPTPVPTDTGGAGPGGDVLAQIMRELAKAIEEGRLKPVVIGPIEVGVPGKAGPSDQPQIPMGDVFGQILRDLLGGKSGQAKPAMLTDEMGSAVFGDRFEVGRNIDPGQFQNLQQVFDQFVGNQRR